LSVRVLKRDVSFEISDVKSVEKLEFENVLLEFFGREGWEINDLSPLSWQFFYDLWVVFKGLGVSETKFSFEKTQISQFYIMRCSFFWISSFAQDVLLQKIDCVFVLAIRGLLHMIKSFLLRCGVILRFNHFLRNLFLWKVSFETTLSWCCRKHVFVFEIVSLKGLNGFMIKLSFSCNFWVKRFQFALMEKVWKLFRFGCWLSFCCRKLNFGIWEGDLWVGPLERC